MTFLLPFSPLAQAGITDLGPEAIFGGAILLVMIGLLISGKVRLEREVTREKEVNLIQEETIHKQRETIQALTSRDREALNLLRELRTAAIARGDIHFAEKAHSTEKSHNDDF